MRHNGAQNIPHVAWTDHRILRLPSSEATPVQTESGTDLSPLLSPTASKRDLAMAYYQAFLDGNRGVEPKAFTLLQQERSAIEADPGALDAFATLSAERGNNQAATETFQRVLKLDPHDLTALSNLGTLYAKQGHLDEAISLLRPAFELNPDIAGLAVNLARVQCAAGDTAGARATLGSALTYSPGLKELQQTLAGMSGCGEVEGWRRPQ
jgi:Flp pilus assembly protein TadD